MFTLAELRRVGTAATMIVICGTAVIIIMTMAMGHYNSLAHAFPKAVLDGAVIALLIGKRSRWRCLSLLGIVYGLVLLLQIGVVYLMPVMAVAGIIAAAAGWAVSLAHRSLAIATAVVLFELLAGFGAPIKIYFGTGGQSEPFIWGLWFAEWPLRIAGALAGMWLSTRLSNWAEKPVQESHTPHPARTIVRPRSQRVARGRLAAGVRLVTSILACVLPMLTDSWQWLGAMAIAAVVYGVAVGLRWRMLHAMLGLVWGWLVLAGLSYLYHQDTARATDMLRTFVLRFMPLTIASVALVTTTRPVDVIRVLRTLRLPRVALLPLTDVVRAIPQARQDIHHGIARLRQDGTWKGPWSMLRHPIKTFRVLLAAPLRRWTRHLQDADTSVQPCEP